jgi:hypothetical protein
VFFFDYLRLKARDAVLAGVQDALDQIDPALAGQPAATPGGVQAPPLPQLGPPDGGASSTQPPETPTAPPADSPPRPPAPPAAGSLQERLAQANTALGVNPAPAGPPKPSSPKRGRGRPDDGGAA